MKLPKIVVVSIAVIAIAAIASVVAYQRRDGIAMSLANSMLADTGVRVADVSVDTVGASRIVFSRLDVELASGTHIAAEKLEVPVNFPSLVPEYVSIATLRVTTADDDAQATPLQPQLRDLLGLPARFPNTALTIDSVELPGWPTITGLVWNATESLQRLHGSALGYVIDAEMTQADPVTYRLSATASTPADLSAATLEALFVDEQDTLQIKVYGSAEAQSLLMSAAQLDAVPAGLESATGLLLGMTEIDLDYGGPGQLAFNIYVATDDKLDLRTSLFGDTDVTLRLPVDTPTEFRIELPERAWSLRSPQSQWTIDIPGLEYLPVRITELSCARDERCTLDVDAGPGPVEIAGLEIERAVIGLPLAIDPASPNIVELPRAPSLFMTGISHGDVVIGSLTTIGLEKGRAELLSDGVEMRADSVSLNLTNMTFANASLNALALNLSDLQFLSTSTQQVRTRFATPAGTGSLTYGEYSLRFPETSGSVRLADGEMAIDSHLSGSRNSVTANVALRYDPDSDTGSLTMTDGRLDFGQRPLSEIMRGLPTEFDLLAGNVELSANIGWAGAEEHAAQPSTFTVDFSDLTGRYKDMAASGIQGSMDGSLTSAGVMVEHGRIRASLMDVGFPLKALSAQFSSESVDRIGIRELELNLLGGRVTADPFSYDLKANAGRMTLRPENIELSSVAQVAGIASVELEGTVSGAVPLVLAGNRITVSAGELRNEPPGGVIRVAPETAAEATGSTDLNLASRALQNFRFDSLLSGLEYGDSGDLVMQMRISGVNPDMDPNQPVILNLNLENNIPELLRSLRAVRSIEDVLERAAGQR